MLLNKNVSLQSQRLYTSAFFLALFFSLFFAGQETVYGNSVTVTRGHQPLLVGWAVSGGYGTSPTCAPSTNASPAALATAWMNKSGGLLGTVSLPAPTDLGTFEFRCTHVSGVTHASYLTVNDCILPLVWNGSACAAASIPTLSATLPTSITTTGATLGANVTSDGGSVITDRGTCWGTTNPPLTNCAAEGGTALGVFSHARTGMTTGTLIYYRGYATNAVGTGYSAVSSFSTVTAAPTGVTVTPQACGTAQNLIDWSDVSGAASYSVYSSTGVWIGNSVFSSYTHTGTANTAYSYYVRANTAAGLQSANSATVLGTTPVACVAASIPTLSATLPTSITTTGATLGANVTSDGGSVITDRGTCWGTTNPPLTNCAAEGGTALGVFSHARTGMTTGTLIYYRGYATNAVGTGYSAVDSFSTVTLPACDDTIDNDGDGRINFPQDAGCSSLSDTDESGPTPVVTFRVCDPGPINCVAGKTVDINTLLVLQWSSPIATRCDPVAGSGFVTGGATADTDEVNAPSTPGIAETYTIACMYGTGIPVRSDVVITTTPGPVLLSTPNVVRIDDNVELSWDTNNNDESLCTLTGPGVNLTSGPTGGMVTNGTGTNETGFVDVIILGKSTFTLTCPTGVSKKTIIIIPSVGES